MSNTDRESRRGALSSALGDRMQEVYEGKWGKKGFKT